MKHIKWLLLTASLLLSAQALAVDTDGDGVDDAVDAFPSDVCASVDTDGDGYPDQLTNCYFDNFDGQKNVTWTSTGYSLDLLTSGYSGKAASPYSCSYSSLCPSTHYFTANLTATSELSFYYYNYTGNFVFDVDGTTYALSSSSSWSRFSIILPAGSHVVKWIANSPMYKNLKFDEVVIGAGTNLVADTDDDNDGVIDTADVYPLDNTRAGDIDGDGVDGFVDNCPANANADQADTDGDGLIDACTDSDDDNDGIFDAYDKFPLNLAASVDDDIDGVPTSWNAACDATCQANSGLALDNCPTKSNPTQTNFDGDAQGDACDADDDNDGVADTADKFPLDANRWQRVRHNTDFDNDSDVLVRSASLGTWTRYSIQNNAIVGNGVINAPTSSDSVYVAQLDANGDGDADILTRSASTGAWTLSIVENGALTSSVPLYLYANLGYVFVGVGDFNNDGTDDVMLRHATNGYRVFLLANHAVSSSVYYNAWLSASSVDQGIGDFDGDGTDDLLVRRTSDNLYFIFKTIDGAVNNYYCACNIWANPDWSFQFAGDTNKDGIDDIVIRGTGASADGKWWAFRMNNFSSVLTTNLNLFLNKSAVSVGAVGDYNGDGTIDVLTRVNNSTTYVSPIVNGTITGNYWLYNFTSDQVIGK